MYPEVSSREERIAGVVAAKLGAFKLEDIRTGLGKHGVIEILKGGKPGLVVSWRADMDALPVTSVLKVPYKSQNQGLHHACGHMHT